MGFREADYNKAKKAMFNASESSRNKTTTSFAREKLYKQAGNSITVNVLEAIFYYVSKK